MKINCFILAVLLMSSVVQANSECYNFNVSKNASDLLTVRISVDSNKKSFVGNVTGSTVDKKIENDFACKRTSNKITCEHSEGAGDFVLDTGAEVKLSFSYVNLAIGAKGSNAPKPNQEITEEFAFLDMSPAENDDEEDAGELGEVSIKGTKVQCDSKL